MEGLALGSQAPSEHPGYSEFQCGPSEVFSGLTWCQRNQRERTGPRDRSVSTSILHTPDGRAAYVNRVSEPVVFAAGGLKKEIDRLSAQYGKPLRLLSTPQRDGLPDGVIATWGTIQLEPLDPESVATLAAGGRPRKGLLVDYLGNFQRSAKHGLPIYKLGGGAGYVWSGSADRNGRGHQRAFVFDADLAVPSTPDTPAMAALSSAGVQPPADAQTAPEKPVTEPAAADQPAADKEAADKAAADMASADKAAADKAVAEQAGAEKVAAEKAAAERVAAEKATAEGVAAEKATAERVAADKATAEKLAALTAAEKDAALKRAEKTAAEKVAALQVAFEKAAAEKDSALKAALEKAAAEQASNEVALKTAAEKAAAEKAAALKAAAEQAAAEKDAAVKAAAEKAVAANVAALKAANEKVAALQAAAEQAAAEKDAAGKTAAEKAMAESVAALKAANEKVAALQAAAEQAAAEKEAALKAVAEKAAAEKIAALKVAAEKAAADKDAAVKATAEKAAAEKIAALKAAADKATSERAAGAKLALAQRTATGQSVSERAAAAHRVEPRIAKFRGLFVGMPSDQFAAAIKALGFDMKLQVSSYREGDSTEHHLLLEAMSKQQDRPVMYVDVRNESPLSEKFAALYGLKVLDKASDYTIFSGLNPPQLPKFTVRRLVFYPAFFDATGMSAEEFSQVLLGKYKFVGDKLYDGSKKDQCDQCLIGLLATGESVTLRLDSDGHWALEVEQATEDLAKQLHPPKL